MAGITPITGTGSGSGDAVPSSYLDTDVALTANSDTKVATQKATKAYVDAAVISGGGFTEGQVRDTDLAGLSTATGTAITSADTVLTAAGKLQKQITDNDATADAHIASTSNPHSVTKTQVGLGSVDNTSDANKPVSTDQAAADAATLASANSYADGLIDDYDAGIQTQIEGLITQTIIDATTGQAPSSNAVFDALALKANVADIGTAGALDIDTDVDLTADSDSLVPSQKAVKAYVDANAGGGAGVDDAISDGQTTRAPSQNAVFDALALKIPTSYLDTDVNLAADSDSKIATQKATKAYVDAAVIGGGGFTEGQVRDTDLAGLSTASATAVVDTDTVLIGIGKLQAQVTANDTAADAYADAKVADAINNGTTTVAPSQNAVFDALALKANLDTAQTFTKAQRGAVVALTDAATVAIDASLSNQFSLNIAGNRTLGAPTNPVAGQTGAINVRQDTTGSRTLAYSWPYIWADGVVGVLSTPGCSLDKLVYEISVYAQSVVTITIATPGVVSWTAHGLKNGQRVQITTTGALPTGLTASTTYFVSNVSADAFSLSTTLANAAANTRIATTGSQSGTHTMTAMSIEMALNKAYA